MNERLLLDLYVRSGLEAYMTMQHHGDVIKTNDGIRRLAELIVRECADLLETNGNNQYMITTVEPDNHTKTPEWREGYEEAVREYGGFLLKKNAKKIKKHFGIE